MLLTKMVRYHAVGARIGIDARNIQRAPNGLGTYARNLVDALTALETSHAFVIIRRPDSGPPVAMRPHVEEVVIDGDPSTPSFGRAISQLRLDLFHSLHHFLPFGLRVPRVVLTLHDLIWLEHPSLIRSGGVAPVTRAVSHLYARVAMPYAVRHADHVIAISAYTRARALSYFGVSPDKISVVHHGVEHARFRPADHTVDASPYFLCLGNSRPYKNLPVAIRAFAAVAKTRPAVRLVVAGRGDTTVELRALATQLGIDGRVTFEALPSHDRLLTLLQGAVALLFPSLIEGFGLPVLEAMAAGCPVVISTCPTLTEVAGPAAIACPATDESAFASAMLRLLDDPGLRTASRQRGLEQAASFTWDLSARRTLAVYEDVLMTRPQRAQPA